MFNELCRFILYRIHVALKKCVGSLTQNSKTESVKIKIKNYFEDNKLCGGFMSAIFCPEVEYESQICA